MATRDVMWTRQHTGDWVKEGAIGGVIAGAIFAMFEMVIAAILDGGSAFWNPLRMIGAMVLGDDALMSSYSLWKAALTGIVLHMMLSLAFGVVFGLVVSAVPALARTSGTLIASAGLYGLVLWLVNFYVIAPVAGWDWFPDKTNETVQFVAHVGFFGIVLGWIVDRLIARHRTSDRS
jgi:hypothetical protein